MQLHTYDQITYLGTQEDLGGTRVRVLQKPRREDFPLTHLCESSHQVGQCFGVRALQLLNNLKALVQLSKDINHRAGKERVVRCLLKLWMGDKAITVVTLGYKKSLQPFTPTAHLFAQSHAYHSPSRNGSPPFLEIAVEPRPQRAAANWFVHY